MYVYAHVHAVDHACHVMGALAHSHAKNRAWAQDYTKKARTRCRCFCHNIWFSPGPDLAFAKFVMEQNTFSCQLCRLLSPDLRSYISHVRQVHSKDPNFSLTCEIRECSQQFSSFGAFNSHVYRAHRDSLGLNTSANDDAVHQHSSEAPTSSTLSATQSDFPVLYCFGDHELPEDLQYDIWHLLGVDQQQEQREAAKFLLKLKEICRVSEHTVNKVVSGYRRLFAHSLRVVKGFTW